MSEPHDLGIKKLILRNKNYQHSNDFVNRLKSLVVQKSFFRQECYLLCTTRPLFSTHFPSEAPKG